MKIALLLVAGALAVIASAQKDQHRELIKGSGHAKTETRRLGSFTKVRCDGVGSIEATVGGRKDVEVTGDDNLIGYIKTHVEGDTLVISSEKDVSFQPKTKLQIRFSVPSLRAAELRGAADIKVTGLKGGDFDVDLGGAGGISAAGSADDVRVHLRGAGNVNLKDLNSKSMDVELSGVGNARVRTTGTLKAHVTGVGNVEYFGQPRSVTKNVTGMGSVRSANR